MPGPYLATAAALGAAATVGLVLLLVRRPWLAPWFVVPVFAVSAELQLRTTGSAGVLKDVVVVVVVVACAIRVHRSRELLDRLRWFGPPLGALGLVVVLYLANPLGHHDLDWFLSVRLILEACGLLLAGLLTGDPDRTRRHLVLAVAVVAAGEAALAWVQHLVGQSTLIYSWGYQFGAQVRETSSGGLRTSGTFSEPFSLAALGVLALCLGLFLARGRVGAVLVVSAVAIVGATSVRTAMLQVLLVLLVWALHRGWWTQAAVATVAAVAGGVLAGSIITTAAYPGATPTPLLLGLNGRTTVWSRAVDGPLSFLAGNGVAQVGSGSDRSAQGLVTSAASFDPGTGAAATIDPSTFLDSAYAQVQSDTGVLGTIALLIWVLGTLAVLVRVARSPAAGPLRSVHYGALALLLAVSLDWVGRTTLFAFPTGFLVLFVLGVLCADADPRLARRPRAPAVVAPGRTGPAGTW